MGSYRPFQSLETCVTFFYSIKIHRMSEQIGQQRKLGASAGKMSPGRNLSRVVDLRDSV